MKFWPFKSTLTKVLPCSLSMLCVTSDRSRDIRHALFLHPGSSFIRGKSSPDENISQWRRCKLFKRDSLIVEID